MKPGLQLATETEASGGKRIGHPRMLHIVQ